MQDESPGVQLEWLYYHTTTMGIHGEMLAVNICRTDYQNKLVYRFGHWISWIPLAVEKIRQGTIKDIVKNPL